MVLLETDFVTLWKALPRSLDKVLISHLKSRNVSRDAWMDWVGHENKIWLGKIWDGVKVVEKDDVVFLNLIKKKNPKGFEAWSEVVAKPENIISEQVAPINPKTFSSSRIFDSYATDYIKVLTRNHLHVVWAPMNSGKTWAVNSLIKENPDIQFIVWITSRQSMADGLVGTLKSFPLLHYSDLRHNTDLVEFGSRLILVIQLESLHKLLEMDYRPLDLLVIDECTSIAKQLSSKTMNSQGKYVANVSTLEELAKNSRQVVCMDADVDERIYLMLETWFPGYPIQVQQNRKMREGKAIRYSQKAQLAQTYFTRLSDGIKLFIACSTLADANYLFDETQKNFPKLRGALHTAETAELHRKDLSDVNSYWSKMDYVIVSPSITNGLDFNVKDHFDEIFVFAQAGSCPARDIKQQIGRVRFPKQNVVRYHVQAVKGKQPTNLFKIKQQMDYIHRYQDKITAEAKIAKANWNWMDSVYSHYFEKTSRRIIDLNGVSTKIQDQNHWLFDVWAMNIQEDNLSWNDLQSELEKQLKGIGFTLETTTDPELVEEAIEAYASGKRILKMKQVADKIDLYKDTWRMTDEEAKVLEATLPKLKDKTLSLALLNLERHEVERNFDVPVKTGEDLRLLKSRLVHIRNMKIQELVPLEHLAFSETLHGHHPLHPISVKQDIFRKLLTFLDVKTPVWKGFNYDASRFERKENLDSGQELLGKLGRLFGGMAPKLTIEDRLEISDKWKPHPIQGNNDNTVECLGCGKTMKFRGDKYCRGKTCIAKKKESLETKTKRATPYLQRVEQFLKTIITDFVGDSPTRDRKGFPLFTVNIDSVVSTYYPHSKAADRFLNIETGPQLGPS